MYTENHRHASIDRANNEFLRRMLGGELMGGARAVMNEMEDESQKPHLPGCGTENNCTEHMESEQEAVPHGARGEERPQCNEGDEAFCPKYMQMPSLAMVYAPHQCWQNLLDPETALERGSQFAELILPFDAGDRCMRMGGGKGRC